MTEAATIFTPWDSFYVIVGSSAAALTGLQFVVMALVADANRKGTSETLGAFSTPTVVHFCMALAVSAVLSAPWRGSGAPSFLLVTTGLGGLIYTIIVTVRAGRQTAYKPVFEDWLWHNILPIAAYTTLLVAAIALARGADDGLYGVASTALLLVFIGIHNAWDSVAFVATMLHTLPPAEGTKP
jgi:hypothetical protein